MIDALPSVANAAVVESQSRQAETDDGFGFDDFLDIFNPLQHLPLVGTAYRALTGDEIEAPARLAGAALYGGLAGFLGVLGAFAFEGIRGESVDQTLLSVFDGGDVADDPYRVQRAYASAKALID